VRRRIRGADYERQGRQGTELREPSRFKPAALKPSSSLTAQPSDGLLESELFGAREKARSRGGGGRLRSGSGVPEWPRRTIFSGRNRRSSALNSDQAASACCKSGEFERFGKALAHAQDRRGVDCRTTAIWTRWSASRNSVRSVFVSTCSVKVPPLR